MKYSSPAMRSRATFTSITLMALMSLAFSGCSLNDKFNVQAEAGRPEGSQVEQISIPYDASKPKFLLVVEPFESSQGVLTVAYGQGNSVPIADQMSAQLITALTKVGNFAVYDRKHRGSVKAKKGEKGPYILRATLTEFN